MFRHLLVPLDGSHLAESVLPATVFLGHRLGARVTLFHAVERGAPTLVHGDRHLTQPGEAEAYLRQVAEWLATQGVQATSGLSTDVSDVATGIADFASGSGVDLIVLGTHGGSGVRVLLFGRVAQQVLQRGSIPVFLIQPSAQGRDQTFTCTRILVPLDGSETAEIALPAASAMAQACRAGLHLVWVVPTVVTVSGERAAVTKLMPTAAAVLLDEEAGQARRYLESVRARLLGKGVEATLAVDRGEPVRVLLDEVVKQRTELIVMATHGRSGVGAVWAGSVASRIVGQSTKPVLLIRIPLSATGSM